MPTQLIFLLIQEICKRGDDLS